MSGTPSSFLYAAMVIICVCRSNRTRHAPAERLFHALVGLLARLAIAASASSSKAWLYVKARISCRRARNISLSGHMISRYLSPVITSSFIGKSPELSCGLGNTQFNAGMASHLFAGVAGKHTTPGIAPYIWRTLASPLPRPQRRAVATIQAGWRVHKEQP